MKAQFEPVSFTGSQSGLSRKFEPPENIWFQQPVFGNSPPNPSDKFTVAEHLQVQREIERRAYWFWRRNGCGRQTALSDWLHGETQVLTEFISARLQGRPLAAAFDAKGTRVF